VNEVSDADDLPEASIAERWKFLTKT